MLPDDGGAPYTLFSFQGSARPRGPRTQDKLSPNLWVMSSVWAMLVAYIGMFF
jgi:hypothetical protein